MSREKALLPDDLSHLQQRLEQWRSGQASRSRIPEPFWVEAVEMARVHGLHATSQALRMDYMRLKKRLSPPTDVPATAPQSASPGFLEWFAPHPALAECVVELESAGGKMRVALKGATLDWGGLLRAWREAAK